MIALVARYEYQSTPPSSNRHTEHPKDLQKQKYHYPLHQTSTKNQSQRNKRPIKPHAALVALLAEIRPREELERGGGKVRARCGPVVCAWRAGAVAEDGEAELEDCFEGLGGEEVVVGAVCFALV